MYALQLDIHGAFLKLHARSVNQAGERQRACWIFLLPSSNVCAFLILNFNLPPQKCKGSLCMQQASSAMGKLDAVWAESARPHRQSSLSLLVHAAPEGLLQSLPAAASVNRHSWPSSKWRPTASVPSPGSLSRCKTAPAISDATSALYGSRPKLTSMGGNTETQAAPCGRCRGCSNLQVPLSG